MSNLLDLTGLNLQPISLQRSEMSHAMCILDDLLFDQGFDPEDDGAHVPTVVSPERKSRPTSNDEESTEWSLADYDDNDDDMDHLSVGCIKAFDDDNLEEMNHDDSCYNENKSQFDDVNVNNARAHSPQPSPSCSRHNNDNNNDLTASDDEASHHDVSLRACFCPPTTDTTGTRDAEDLLSAPEHVVDPRRPLVLVPVPYSASSTIGIAAVHQQEWEQPHYHHYHYYGTLPPFSASATGNSNSNYSMHPTLDMTTASTSTTSPFQSPPATMMPTQQQQSEGFQCVPQPSHDVVQSSAPLPPPYLYQDQSQQSPYSAACSSRHPTVVSPMSASMPTWPAPQQKRKQKRSSKKPIKARASPISKASKATGKKDKKTDTPESSLRPIHHLKWQRRYDDLLEFKKQHGHCLVPIAYEAVPTLPHWVKRQRNQYKKKLAGEVTTLTDERQQILDDAGFVWDSHQALWSVRLAECRVFVEKHGHCSIPARYAANSMLAVWAKCQRRQFKIHKKGGRNSLTAKRVNELNELGFVWDPLGPRP